MDEPKLPESDTSRESSIKAFRFSIFHMLYATALIASGIAVFGVNNLWFSLFILAGWVVIFQTHSRTPRLDGLGCSLFLLIALVCGAGLILPVSRHHAHLNVNCANSMRQLLLALHNYDSAYKSFPAATELDANGKPMHSWRIRILPFIEENDLYSKYNFNEPWDGPNNSLLADSIPRVFQCPGRKLAPGETTYKLISDPEAFFDGPKRPTFSEVTDGSSNTVVLIEDPSNPINWMEPEDLSIDEALKVVFENRTIDPHVTEDAFSKIIHAENMCFLDSSTEVLDPDLAPEVFRELLTANEGTSPPQINHPSWNHSTVVSKPQGYIALAIYFGLVLLPAWFFIKAL